MDTKYGEFSQEQVNGVKKSLQKSIFFLLLYVDPATKGSYQHVDIDKAFEDLQYKICGLNELFNHSVELVMVMSILEKALLIYQSGNAESEFGVYRKLILDAGAEIMRLKED